MLFDMTVLVDPNYLARRIEQEIEAPLNASLRRDRVVDLSFHPGKNVATEQPVVGPDQSGIT